MLAQALLTGPILTEQAFKTINDPKAIQSNTKKYKEMQRKIMDPQDRSVEKKFFILSETN